MKLVNDVRLRLSETPRKRMKLMRSQRLPTNDQHMTREPSIPKLSERSIVNLREIDVTCFNTKTIAKLRKPHGHDFNKSGDTHRGKNNGISGKMISSASTMSIGINMIMVSFIANLSGTFATAHEIIKHIP